MSEKQASVLLSQRLQQLANLPPVAWQNGPTFEPPVGESWLEEYDMSAGTDELSLSLSGSRKKDGIYQINVYTPTGQGRYKSYDFTDPLTELYRAYKQGGLVITDCSRGKERNEGNFFKTVFEVYYTYIW